MFSYLHLCIALPFSFRHLISTCITGTQRLKMSRYIVFLYLELYRNEIEATDPVVKELISYKVMNRFH